MIKDTLTYDIVGSFLRPAEIKEARKAYKDSKITKEELTQAEDLAIASLVEKEVAHGLKYVTDGEFRRRWWHLDWLKEFDGFDTIHFTKEINGTSNEIELGTVTGKFFYDKNKAHPELCAWDYLHSLEPDQGDLLKEISRKAIRDEVTVLRLKNVFPARI